MQQPITLTVAPTQPASAAVLPGIAAAELAPLLAGFARWPRLYRLADGYLLVPDDAATDELARLPGAILLRRQADNLYLPRDAVIRPALHSDEADALGDGWGLVLLPGPLGQQALALAYDPQTPLAPEQLLAAPQPVRRLAATPLPQRQFPADDLCAITRPAPVAPLEELLAGGAAGIDDAPDTDSDEVGQAGRAGRTGRAGRAGRAGRTGHGGHNDSAGGGSSQRVSDQARLGLGQFLAGLGRALRIRWLARMGGRMMSRALRSSPRLSWKLFGQHEAALRDLLRRFQEGKVDEALRRALPLAGPDEFGQTRNLSAGSRLPYNEPRFSLRELLGPAECGGATWLVEPDLHTSLRNAYLQAANAALQRGDHLRAAYIHAKLLGDFHTAALVLARGGHFREAAILYRDKLNNPLAAAAQFESACDYDEALRLYRACHAYVQLGDLLARLDRPEQAREAYLAAAQEIVRNSHNYLEAARLITQKLRDPELAATYYAQGWTQRLQGLVGRAVPCGLALAKYHLQRNDHAALMELLRQAQDTFSPAGHTIEAGHFFNELTSLVEAPAAQPVRQAVRDASLLLLASKVRERLDQTGVLGSAVSELLGSGGNWSSAVISDANFAAKARLAHRNRFDRPDHPDRSDRSRLEVFRLSPPEHGIIASVQARVSAHIAFLTAAGTVGWFDPRTGQTHLTWSPISGAHSLCIDDYGQQVLVLVGPEPYLVHTVLTLSGRSGLVDATNYAPWQPDDIPLQHTLNYRNATIFAVRYRRNTDYDKPGWGHTLLLQTGTHQLPLTLTLDEPERIQTILAWPRLELFRKPTVSPQPNAPTGYSPRPHFLIWHRSTVSVAWLVDEQNSSQLNALPMYINIEELTPACELPWQPEWASSVAARTQDSSQLNLAGIDQAGAVWYSAVALIEPASLQHLHTGSFVPPAPCVGLTIMPNGTVVALDQARQLHTLHLTHTGQLRPRANPIPVSVPPTELPTAVYAGVNVNEVVVLCVGGTALRVSVN